MSVRPETYVVQQDTVDCGAAGALIPPISLSTTFTRGSDGELASDFLYARTGNPNRRHLEHVLAQLEGGSECLAFASGSAATMTVFQTLSPGAHVIIPSDCYYNTAELMSSLFARWGLAFSRVDMTDLTAVSSALRKETALIWVETPSNPLLKVTDLAALSKLARESGALLAVDNTLATPLLQNPIALGADLVMHSTTKYLGGHSDVTGGAVIARESSEIVERLRVLQGLGGVVPSPFDCWLLCRGIRTLAVRMRVHCENALRVAEFLAGHPAVEAVHYPGLAAHLQHQIARQQMRGFGGVLSFQIRGDRARSLEVAGRLKIFKRATSLGGTESLAEHRATVEVEESRSPDNLLRLSVGLEHADDLLSDLERALDRA